MYSINILRSKYKLYSNVYKFYNTIKSGATTGFHPGGGKIFMNIKLWK